MKVHLVLSLALVFGAACAKKKDSNNAPVNMSKALEVEAEKVKTEIASSESRSESMDQLINTSEGVGSKMVTARDYFLNMEFQRIHAVSAQDKEAMYLTATNEFISYISDIHSKIRPKRMSPLKKGKNAERTFYAIADAMDVVSKNNKISFYDLVRTAMINDTNGDELAPHEKVMMAGPNRDIMVDLIKARVDVKAAEGLKFLTNKENQSLLQKGSRILYDISMGLIGSLDLPETFSESNEITKDEAVRNMTEALKAKNFLREFGITKDLERRVRSTYSKIELNMPSEVNPESEEESLSPKELKNLENRRIEIRNLINNLLQ